MDKNFKQPFKIILANFSPRQNAFIYKNNSLTVSKKSALKRSRKYFSELFLKIYT